MAPPAAAVNNNTLAVKGAANEIRQTKQYD
jgi:hypothetical protein